MSDLLRNMQGSQFKSTLRACANEYNLRFNSIDGNFASMLINKGETGQQLVMFSLYDTTIEFLATTGISFEDVTDFPGIVSNHLLKDNQDTKLGFWSIKDFGESHEYVVIYNIELSLLTPKLFGNVVFNMCHKVDNLYNTIEAINNSLA